MANKLKLAECELDATKDIAVGCCHCCEQASALVAFVQLRNERAKATSGLICCKKERNLDHFLLLALSSDEANTMAEQ